MSSTVQWTVSPKTIDSDSNETDLTQYTIQQSYDFKTTYETVLQPNADKVIEMPTVADHKVIEFISDQNVHFKVVNAAGTTLHEFEDTNNVIMKFGTVKNYTYEVRNVSGSDAEITWRLYA